MVILHKIKEIMLFIESVKCKKCCIFLQHSG